MINDMSPKEYRKYADKAAPKSKTAVNTVKAFLVGGLICVLGQITKNIFIGIGMDEETAGSVNIIWLIFLGAILTGLNLYDDIGHFAGAGSIVPITGFANSIVSPAMEFKKEGPVMGVGARMFTIAGPVLVYGISLSVAVGILYYLLK